MLQYTHIYMEMSLQPDPVGNMRRSTEELPLNESLVDQYRANDVMEHLKLLLPVASMPSKD